MVPRCVPWCSHTGQLFILPQPVMSWTASTPSDGGRAHSGTQRTANRPETRSGPAFAPGSLFSKDMTTSGTDGLDRLFAAHPRLRVAWDALQVYGERSPRRPRRSSTLRRPLRNRSDSRVPHHRGHHPQLVRRDPELVRRNPELAPQPPFRRQPNPPCFTNPQNYAARGPNMNPTTNQPDHNPTIREPTAHLASKGGRVRPNSP